METAQTADYALRVLLELERQGDQTVSELARHLDLNRAVLQRIVATLHARSLLTRTPSSRYSLGPGLLALGAGIPHELAPSARLIMLELAEAVGEVVVLAVPDGDEAEVIAQRSGNRGALRIEYSIGFRHSLARGASGLAMLAFMESTAAQRLVSSAESSRLERIREAGYVVTEGEIREFMVGIAAPVLTTDRGVVGSLGIVMPTARAHGIEEIIVQVVAAARTLSEEFALVQQSRRPGVSGP